MNQSSSSLWIVALLAFAGIFRLSTPTGPTSAQTGASARGAGESGKKIQKTSDTISKLLKAYYSSTSDDDAVNLFKKELGRVVIALVPDPIDTRIAYRFDEGLEAIQTGAQDERYILDRFSLPWPKGSKDNSKDNEEDAFRLHPGAILFRRAPGDPLGPLLVLLVGETPTAGVHRDAFKESLNEARILSPSPLTDIRIVGPNFSGSVKSLQTVLQQWKADPTFTVHFFSGNTTSLDARRFLSSTKAPPVRFYGTVLPDQVTEDSISIYFAKLGVEPSKIAVLVEADSGYGASVLKNQDSKDESGETLATSKSRYTLPYPMQISQVRTRYQKEVALDSAVLGIGEDPARASLRLSIDEGGTPVDKPEPYAPGPSANIAELSMSAIIDTLHRERITHVGLYGTDTRDKLFLARLIRSRFKNIQFFTDDSDILYAHPDYAADLWGMLVFSTYPLVSEEFTWGRDAKDGPDTTRLRQFSSQMAQALHNATRLALKIDPPENEPTFLMARNPFDGQQALLPGYGPPLLVPGKGDLPHLWVTAVGNSALWPVYTINPWGDSRPASAQDINLSHSRAFLGLVSALNLFCLVEFLLFNGVVMGLIDDRVNTVFRDAQSHAEDPGIHRVSRIAVTGYLAVLFLMSGVTTIVAFLLPAGAAHFGLHGQALELLSIATVALMLDAVILAGFRIVRDKPIPFGIRLAVFVLEFAAVLGGYFAVKSAWIVDPASLMLYLRSVRLSSGLSPFLPFLFLCAGVAVWLICFLKRTQITVSMRNVQPYPTDSPTSSSAGFFRLRTLINDAMLDTCRVSSFNLGSLATLVLASAMLFGAYKANFFTLIEVIPVGRVFWLLAAALVIGLIGTMRDFVYVAYQLLRFQRRLAFHRLAPAFESLSPKVARGLSTDLLASPPALSELQESFNLLVDIRNEFSTLKPEQNGLTEAQVKALPEDLDTAMKRVGDTLAAEFGKAAATPSKKWALPSKTQKELCDQARALFTKLCTYWDTQVFDGLSPESRKALERPYELCGHFVASQIIAHLNAVFVYLRYLIVCAGAMLLSLLLAVSCYPYSAQNVMMNSAWALVIVCSFVFLATFIQFSQTELLRAIRTKDGVMQSSHRAMVTQLLVFALLPALVFLSSHFPTLGRVVLAWVAPAMKSINL